MLRTVLALGVLAGLALALVPRGSDVVATGLPDLDRGPGCKPDAPLLVALTSFRRSGDGARVGFSITPAVDVSMVAVTLGRGPWEAGEVRSGPLRAGEVFHGVTAATPNGDPDDPLELRARFTLPERGAPDLGARGSGSTVIPLSRASASIPRRSPGGPTLEVVESGGIPSIEIPAVHDGGGSR